MDWTLGNTLRRHVGARGGETMMIYGDRTITWSQMHERSAQVAQALLAEGVTSEDRVAYLDKNGPEFFEVLFGGGMINAVTVAVNWRLAPPEVEYIVNAAQARVLVVGPEFVHVAEEIESGLTTAKKIVVVGGAHNRYDSFEAWIGGHDAVDPEAPSRPDDVAIQLYTSGTTGLPKGAMLTNSNFATVIDEVAPQWSLTADSVSPVCMP